ncbi:phage integrase SAM-like domain-containing protein [Phocaeicola plebeius]|uniref:phage integrase SAM-like domain-containing protein n=1 Tax=Phocaeicola plebeius TaxID=310297 RepID=UPI0034E981B8
MLKKEHDIPLEQIRPSHIHQYQNFLEKREQSSTTVRIYLTLIKVICLCTNNSSYNLYFSMYSYKR